MNTAPQHPYFNPSGDENIDFKRYVSLFISNWYWFAGALFISLSIAYGINRWSDKVYTVTSTLLIKDDKFSAPNSDLTNIFPGTSYYNSQQNLENEIGILKSFELNYKVIEQLPEFLVDYISVGKRGIVESRLYKRCPFVVVYDSLEKQRIGQKVRIKILSDQKYSLEIKNDKTFTKVMNFGDRFNEMGYDFKIILKSGKDKINTLNSSNRYYFYFNNPSVLANTYRNKLTATPIQKDASLVTLTISGFEPNQEADYLNKLMDVYINFGLDVKNETARQTITFIDDQLKQISDSLHHAEGNLESFRLENKLIDISNEGNLIQKKLEQIDAEKADLDLQESYYVYLKNYIESKKESKDIVAPSIVGISDQLLMKLVDKLAELQQKKKELGMNLNTSTEPLNILETQIITTRNSISENITNGLKNIENSKEEVERKSNEVLSEIRKLPSTERKMISIQRRFDINNTVYTFLLEKRAEAGIAKASNVPDNRIIDFAGYYNSSKIRPREKKNLMLSLILGLMIPAISIILIDYLNNKIIDKKDIEKGTTVPILGFISHNNLHTEIPVAERPSSTLAESFRSVRTNLKYVTKDSICPVISVTSTISAEGKTFVSANLATIIASNGKKVLLVGLDLRKPRIHKMFGLNNDTGLSTLLIGDEIFDNVIWKTKIENLWYAPSGPVPPNPAELIESEPMVNFILKAKKQFDCIIIDTPPVAIVTDALLVDSITDLYLFVVRQRYSSKSTLELIEDLNKSGSIKNLGIIINDISLSGYYGYGLRYGYSLGYGYNYGYNYYNQNSKYGYKDSAKGYYQKEDEV